MRIDNIIMAPYHKRTWQVDLLPLSSAPSTLNLVLALTIGLKLGSSSSMMDEVLGCSTKHDFLRGNNAM